jgi:type VI secretion system protein ImpJ
MTSGTGGPEAKDIPDAVLWHEGMLLGPQHFQLASRRIEQLVAYVAAAALPYRWGLRRLSIAASRLAEGSFEIETLEGVMPDGLVVCHPLEDAEPLAFDLATDGELLRKGTGTLHLAVLAQRAGLRIDPETNLGRYGQHSHAAVADEFDEDGRVEVAFLRPALSLILTAEGQEPPLKFTTLPLAKIGIEDGRFVARPFAPPHLAVDRHSALHKLVGDAVAKLRDKAATRSEYLKTSGIGGFSLEAAQLRALVAPLPRLEAMIDHGASHPYDLYLALADAIGALSCLGGLTVPQKLPDYVHADPLPGFRTLIDRLQLLIDQLEERFDKYLFENLGDGRFRLELQAPWLTRHLHVQLFAGATQPLWQVEQWARRALIGDQDRMPQIREARAQGASRTLIERAEEIDLVRTSDAVLLRIPLRTPSEPNGLQLGNDRMLEIQAEIPQDASGRPDKIILYVEKPKGMAGQP